MRNFIVCVVAVFLGCSHEQRQIVTPAAIASLPAMPVVPSSPRTTFYLDFTTPKGWSSRFNIKENTVEVYSVALDAVFTLQMQEYVEVIDVTAMSKEFEQAFQEEIASEGDLSRLGRWDDPRGRRLVRWYSVGIPCARQRQIFVVFPREHPEISIVVRGEWPCTEFEVRQMCDEKMGEFASSVRVMMIETPR